MTTESVSCMGKGESLAIKMKKRAMRINKKDF